MTSETFAEKIIREFWQVYDLDISTGIKSRDCLVTVSRAHYGRVSAAIIEFIGSPPRLTVMATNLGYDKSQWDIVVNGRVVSGNVKHPTIAGILEKFLSPYTNYKIDEAMCTFDEGQVRA